MKTLTAKMLKFTDKNDWFVESIVSDVNTGRFESITFNPAVVLCGEYMDALKSVIYSIIRVSNITSANEAISMIADTFGTCPMYAERIIRGIDGITVEKNFGLDNLIVK
jgi:hypothetical protein